MPETGVGQAHGRLLRVFSRWPSPWSRSSWCARVRTRRPSRRSPAATTPERPTPASARRPPPPGSRCRRRPRAQPKVAGPSFDVKQSGQFVNLSNTQGTLGGKLRLEGGRAPTARTAHRRRRLRERQDARLRRHGHAGRQGRDHGMLGGARGGRRPEARPAGRRRRPSRAPPARSPVSTSCRRARPASAARSSSRAAARLHAEGGRGRSSARWPTTTRPGAVTGDVELHEGRRRAPKAQAVDRNINNLQLLPLDAATPTGPPTRSGKPRRTTPSGLPPSGEKFTATKQRESFGHSSPPS